VKLVTSDYELRNDMRQLWEDHVFWTRSYLIAAIGGLPGADQARDRLLQNQVDIGNAIKPFYGNEAGDGLTRLLTEHITGAVAVVVAAKAGDTAAFGTAKAAWYANADAIAAYLSSANPNWARADLAAMMHMHLDQTLAEASARLGGDWIGDVAAYDAVVTHILEMSDALSAGIGAQFPKQVLVNPMSDAEQNLHRGLRKLWVDHVAWTHFYLMSAIAETPDAVQTTDRLLRNQIDLGNAVKPFYGDAAGDQLAQLLHAHISGAVAVVAAAKSGDAATLANLVAAWYANADQIAMFLATANPNWAYGDLQSHMHVHLDQTLVEAKARLNGDWVGEVRAYDGVVAHIDVMSDVLSDGIAKQFLKPVAATQ
jgi:hypothetical protein